MAKARGKVVCLTPVTDTVDPAGDRPFLERFTPNWDKQPGAGQEMVRLRARLKKGQVKVARGAGVAT